MIQAAYDGNIYEECPDSSLDHKKVTIGRKLSRVLSIFRKKSTDDEQKGLEPVYEELIYNGGTDISSPQYSFSTLDRIDSGFSSGSVVTDRMEPGFSEILRLGRPYPQVVGGSGWWVRGFRHRAPTLFLPIEELTPIEPAYIDTGIKKDEKANFYRNHFLNKEHINLVGYSRVWGPLVLSVKQEERSYKLILRSVSGTETREVLEPEQTCDWAAAIFGSLAQETFSQVVCLDAWPRILAYDEHSINTVHNIGLLVQREKQFSATSLLNQNSGSKRLSQFLSSFSAPVRGTGGATAYYVRYRENDLIIHPAPVMKTNLERRQRVLSSIVQIVFQEDQVPFSPELMGEDKTVCYVVIQPLDTGSERIRYKISIIAESSVAEFGPKIPEPSVICHRQLTHVLLPLLINANNSCIKSRKMNSLRGRARAELFASLFETLSGWNGVDGNYSGSKIGELIKPNLSEKSTKRMPNNETYMSFINVIRQEPSKGATSRAKHDSGNSSYISSDDCSLGGASNEPLVESSDIPVEHLMQDMKDIQIRLDEKTAEVEMMKKERRQGKASEMASAKGERISRRKSSSTSGHGSDNSSRRREKSSRHQHYHKHKHSNDQSNQHEKRHKKRNSLSRNDTVKESTKTREKPRILSKRDDYAQLQVQKRQKLIERAKSLSDISRMHTGYTPMKRSENYESATSMESLSDIDFTSAMNMIKIPGQIHRAQSHSTIDQCSRKSPTKSIIRKPFNGSPVFGTIHEDPKKAKHNVSFRT